MRLACPKCGDVRETIESFVCQCGWKRTIASSTNTPPPLTHEQRGRRSWAALHSYSYIDEATTRDWFRTWLRTIPRYGCNCQSEFKKILESNPLRCETESEFFQWTVEVHNAVNLKLGKAALSLEEASDIWRSTNGNAKDSGKVID